MKKRKDKFARMLDRLSGTYPNDERTSRINEKGFALCGLFYLIVMAFHSVQVLLFARRYVNSHIEPAVIAPAVFGVMVLIMLVITLKQRSKETPVQNKSHIKLRPAELPRAAAALLSGKSPEDERTVHAFERGFAVCALIGIAYFSYCWLFVVWSQYFWFISFFLPVAPLLLSYVKMRENILTPPRFAHIRLNTKTLLLRLPVYLLGVLPYLFVCSFFPTLYSSIGGSERDTYSNNLFIMFLQVVGDGLKDWFKEPKHISGTALCYAFLIYLIIVIIYEFIVWVYRRQMKKMDAEENDLS